MIEIGTERIALQNRIWIDGWIKIKAQGSDVTDLSPPDGYGHFFVEADSSSNLHLIFKDDDDVEYDLCHPDGSGSTTIINQEFINNIINQFITNIINNVNSPTTAGHLHGLVKLSGDGSTTAFEMFDFVEYVDVVTNAGAVVDPTTYTLSEDRTQVAFDAAPTAGNVLQFNYVIARI